MQGLVVRFQGIANRMPESDPIRAAIDKELDRADEVLDEGRERVRDLRTAEDEVGDLADAFARIARELSSDQAIAIAVERHGAPRELDGTAREEIYRIGREALLNAVRHARATRITVVIAYRDDVFELRVRDDGAGFDLRDAASFERSSHFGLKGMRERAAKLAGTLELSSGPDRGTEIGLVVPARSAHVARPDRFSRRARR